MRHTRSTLTFWGVFVCLLFRAVLLAHGGSQARGKLELSLPAYTTATAARDPSRTCDLHHSSRQCWVLNPLSEARDRTCNLMVSSWIHFHCVTTGTPHPEFFKCISVPVSQAFLMLCLQVTNTPETLRKPSQPPPRPPPDYLHGGSPPVPLPAHLSRAARNSPGAGSPVERKESSRRPPPTRPAPPAPKCVLSQVSGFSATWAKSFAFEAISHEEWQRLGRGSLPSHGLTAFSASW